MPEKSGFALNFSVCESTQADFVAAGHQARDELLAALPLVREGALLDAWFPHRQLSRERVIHYLRRINRLVEDFLAEMPDPDGHVYGLFVTTYRSPPYAQ